VSRTSPDWVKWQAEVDRLAVEREQDAKRNADLLALANWKPEPPTLTLDEMKAESAGLHSGDLASQSRN
jgi:hypothetical protein